MLHSLFVNPHPNIYICHSQRSFIQPLLQCIYINKICIYIYNTLLYIIIHYYTLLYIILHYDTLFFIITHYYA